MSAYACHMVPDLHCSTFKNSFLLHGLLCTVKQCMTTIHDMSEQSLTIDTSFNMHITCLSTCLKIQPQPGACLPTRICYYRPRYTQLNLSYRCSCRPCYSLAHPYSSDQQTIKVVSRVHIIQVVFRHCTPAELICTISLVQPVVCR